MPGSHKRVYNGEATVSVNQAAEELSLVDTPFAQALRVQRDRRQGVEDPSPHALRHRHRKGLSRGINGAKL